MSVGIRIVLALFIVGVVTLREGVHQSEGMRAVTAAHRPRVALLLADAVSSRWIRDYRDLKARLHALYPKAVLDVDNAIDDSSRQLGQADSELSKGARVLIVVPVSPNNAAQIVVRAHQSGAKVISYDRLINVRQLDAYDAFDVVEIGRMQGSWIATHVPRGGKIVLINGPRGSEYAHALRRGYYDDVLARRFRSGYFRRAGDYWIKNWTAEDATKQMVKALALNRSSVQGVLAADDTLAGGALFALEHVGLQGRAVVTGQGTTPDGLRRILIGEQGMTVYEPVADEAYAAAAAANAFLRGRPLPRTFGRTVHVNGSTVAAALFGPMLITRHNVGRVVRDGVITKKLLCIGVPPARCTGF